MKTINSVSALFLLFISISFIACDDSSEVSVPELLDNTSVEEGNQSPFSWFNVHGDYNSEWSDEHSYEGTRSLKLNSDKPDGNFGYWYQLLEQDVPHGKKLRLSCQIKLEGVSGEGVFIALRGDDENKNRVFFYTTQGKTIISGDEDWKKYSVEMVEVIPEEVTKLWVFLILGDNTEGAVYFDEISLLQF